MYGGIIYTVASVYITLGKHLCGFIPGAGADGHGRVPVMGAASK